MVMVLPRGMGFSTAVSGNGSGLGLHTGVSHPCSIDTTREMCPERLPTVMARSSLGFRISVLHIPRGGNHLQQLIHLSKIAPCHKYSGTLSNVVLNEAHFGLTESGFFSVVLRHYLLQSPVVFVLFFALLCWLLFMNLHTGSRCPRVVCCSYFSSSLTRPPLP